MSEFLRFIANTIQLLTINTGPLGLLYKRRGPFLRIRGPNYSQS